jgi:hypothetical protein
MSQQLITANEISGTFGIANTGIVGLITSAQLQPNLTLSGTTTMSGNLVVQGTTTTVNQEIVNTSIITSTSISSPILNGPSTLALQTANTTAVTIAGGNVGIANTNPSQALTVNGNISANGSVNSVNTFGFKNRLINGSFDIWQRGTGVTFLGAGQYLADRWCCKGYQNAEHSRVAVSSRVSGMTTQYAIHVGSSSSTEAGGGTRMDCAQKIESVNCQDMAGQTITMSGWVRFSNTSFTSTIGTTWGNFNAFLEFCTSTTDSSTSTDIGGDSQGGYTYFYTGSYPTSWTYFSQTVTVPAGTNNITFRIEGSNLGCSSTNGQYWYELTQCQIELGSQATSFDRRSYGTELALCQRYYTTLPSQNGTASGTGRTLGTCNGSNTAIAGNLFFPTSMRTAPTITIYGNASTTGNFNFYSAGSGAQVTYTGSAASSTIANSSSVGFGLNMAVTSLPASYTGWADFNVSAGNFGISFTASAEL